LTKRCGGGIQVEKKQGFFFGGSGTIEVPRAQEGGKDKTTAGGGGGQGGETIDGKIFLL
jgi:hypothetical protein